MRSASQVTVACSAPLIGLHWAFRGDSLALGDSLFIKRLWGSDIRKVREQLVPMGGGIGPYTAEDVSGWRYVVTREIHLDDGDELPDSDVLTDGFDDVVSALRLLSDGMVRWHLWWTMREDREECAPYAMTGHRWFFTMTRGYMELQDGDAKELPGLVKKLRRRREAMRDDLCDRLEVALRRFNMMRERRESADKVIDSWVVLEALLGRSDDREELTTVLPRRTSALLKRAGFECPSQGELADMYRLRSKLVHGSLGANDTWYMEDRIISWVAGAAILAWLDDQARPSHVRELDGDAAGLEEACG